MYCTIAVPADWNISKKYEKLEKISKVKVGVIPMVIGALGANCDA